jgi:cytochrome c-type biogenesis protein CcmF
MLLTNNVFLVVAAGSVLLGTLYPLFLDALDLGKISVGPPYFQAVFVPLMTPALFLMGVGPIARWKQASMAELALRLRWALAVSVVSAVLVPLAVAGWSFSQWHPMVSFGLALAFWIFASGLVNLRERFARLPGGLGAKFASQPSGYYGMLVAHLGVAVFIVGITLVKGYEVERDVRMEVGDTVAVGGYTFRFDGAQNAKGPNYRASRGTVRVSRDGKEVVVLRPEKRAYNVSNMPMTEAAIDTGFFGDLYVSLGEPVEGGAWSVRIYYKPFVTWIWGGCAIMALGGLLALADRRYRMAARREERLLPAAPAGVPVQGPAKGQRGVQGA